MILDLNTRGKGGPRTFTGPRWDAGLPGGRTEGRDALALSTVASDGRGWQDGAWHSGQHSGLMSERPGLKVHLCHLLLLFHLSVHRDLSSGSRNMILYHFGMIILDNSKNS